jgi:hypothetical protein
MAVVTGATTTRLEEVDANFNAGRVSIRPPGNNPRAFIWSGATAVISTQAAAQRFFAMRNTSVLTAMLIRYVSITTTTSASGTPAAALELGTSASIVRRWAQSFTGVSTSNYGTVADPPRRRVRMERSRTQDAHNNAAPWDIRIAANAIDVIATTEQFDLDAQPFMEAHAWDLIQAAATFKAVTRMVFDARLPGVYPIVFEPFEGMCAVPVVSTWSNMRSFVHVEWEEVPLNEVEAFV